MLPKIKLASIIIDYFKKDQMNMLRFYKKLNFYSTFKTDVSRSEYLDLTTSVDGIILWLLIWLVNYVAMLLVVCQLSRDVIGYEDS